jgi:hypothetical protein
MLSARQAACRLLAAAWEPQGVPAPDSIPWPGVLRLVEPSNVGGLLYAASRHLALPAEVRQALENAHYRTIADNTRHLHQLGAVGCGLSSLGAPVLLLKGAALVESVYDDISQRLMGDIDLAVHPADVAAGRRLLIEMGYAAGQVEHRSGTLLAFSNQEVFEPPLPHRATVELHWHVLDAPYYLRRVPMEWFWENAHVRSVGGQSFHLLDPEANLIYLPAHLALHHRFRRLHPLLDIALLILRQRDRLDWDRILAAAQSFDLVSVLRETLDRVASCWPSLPLAGPRRLVHALRASNADERLFRLLSADSRSTTLDFYTTLVSLPGTAARARFAFSNLFPQPAYMRGRYRIQAGWQLPYWYLVRLAGGLPRLARVLPHAWRLERGQR